MHSLCLSNVTQFVLSNYLCNYGYDKSIMWVILSIQNLSSIGMTNYYSGPVVRSHAAAGNVTVIVGDTDRGTVEGSERIHSINRVNVHKRFTGFPHYINDIALIELNEVNCIWTILTLTCTYNICN